MQVEMILQALEYETSQSYYLPLHFGLLIWMFFCCVTCSLYYTAQGKVLNDFYESTAGKTQYRFVAVFCFALSTYILLVGSLIHFQLTFSSVQNIFTDCYISLWTLNMFFQENFKLRLGKLGQLKLWQEERIG